jgi:hypothetical protein
MVELVDRETNWDGPGKAAELPVDAVRIGKSSYRS